jgi:DNA-binding transcriptional regulator YiaG
LNAQLHPAETVKAIRQELGLTQQEFATKLGVALPTISRWENRVHKPSPLALDKVASFLRTLGERGLRMVDKYEIGDGRGAA